MFLFKTKEQKELELLTTKLVKTILQNDRIKQLMADARKQWEFEELQTHTLSYPILQDLVNTATHGVALTIKLAGGTVLEIKPDAQASTDEQERRKRLDQRDVW